MLKRPEHSVNVENCLAFADYLESVPPKEFDMRFWCGSPCCIAGHGRKFFGIHAQADKGRRILAEKLGLSSWTMAAHIFNPGPMLATTRYTYGEITPMHAARLMRHLALTGQVDWSVATA